MSGALADRVRGALDGSPFAARSGAVAALLGDAPGADEALARMPQPVLAGLARAAAASPEQARFAVRRRGLLERVAGLRAEWPRERAAELDAEAAVPPADLEDFLDAIRLQRREEMLLAACADFSGLADFEDISRLLSSLAEAIVRRALVAASLALKSAAAPPLAVVAMGKLGGREFTYHSDLDLIFLGEGGVDAVHAASRIAQRLISYVSTQTGAGSAYAVDSRLRPSGNQGMLVTSFDGFEAYQTADAATWEYLALVRARTVAGAREAADGVLRRVQERAFGGGGARWADVADMRGRIEAERAREGRAIELKTGAGGLMDVEFLAEGGVLEKGRPAEPVPAIPALLRACAGAAAEATLQPYRLLRRVESRMRWCAGRAVESMDRDDPRLADVAELVEAGLPAPALVQRVAESRAAVRRAFGAVVRAGTIDALGDAS